MGLGPRLVETLFFRNIKHALRFHNGKVDVVWTERKNSAIAESIAVREQNIWPSKQLQALFSSSSSSSSPSSIVNHIADLDSSRLTSSALTNSFVSSGWTS